jgi:hypothetical protein
MSLCGRNDKRVSMAITAYLLDAEGTRGTEKVVTQNVSARGARVLTKHRWQSGERLRIVGFANEFCEGARVVYCQIGPGNRFCVGLEFQKPVADWWEYAVVKGIVSG